MNMVADAMYYGVFFLDNVQIGYKRININQYLNITDGVIEKQVELEKIPYDIVNIKTFHIQNSVDNTFFVVCDVKL